MVNKYAGFQSKIEFAAKEQGYLTNLVDCAPDFDTSLRKFQATEKDKVILSIKRLPDINGSEHYGINYPSNIIPLAIKVHSQDKAGLHLLQEATMHLELPTTPEEIRREFLSFYPSAYPNDVEMVISRLTHPRSLAHAISEYRIRYVENPDINSREESFSMSGALQSSLIMSEVAKALKKIESLYYTHDSPYSIDGDKKMHYKEIREGIMNGDIIFDGAKLHYSDNVLREKILHSVAQVQGITDGQKMYLAALLFGYAQSIGRPNIGRAIKSIGFVPEGKLFEIETANTSGASKESYEVSLQTLQQRFGLGDLLINNISEIPSIAITNNPEKPLSIIKIISLVMARIVHPGRIEMIKRGFEDGLIRVAYADRDRSKELHTGIEVTSFLTELGIDDFYLNKLENDFVEAKIGMQAIQRAVKHLIFDTNGLQKFLPEAAGRGIKSDSSKLLSKLKELAFGKERMGRVVAEQLKKILSQDEFVSQVDLVILSARKELHFLNQQQAQELIAKLDTGIKVFQDGIDSTSKLFSKYPDLAQMQIHGGNNTIKAVEFLTEAREALYNLEEIRNAIVKLQPSAASPVSAAGSSALNLKEPLRIKATAGNGTVSNLTDTSASPAQKDLVSLAVEHSDKGGIDFRALPVVSSPINPAMFKLSPSEIKRLNNFNLDAEWAEIQNMLKAGIIPSNQRLKEYVASSCLRQALAGQMPKVLGCIANILRIEEDRVAKTEPELEDMLVLIESGKPESELQLGLAQIKILPREPQLITP